VRTSWTHFFGLEGRPCIARGEPRFAAEPRECGRRKILGRVQDIATHRRSPSPQQPEAGLVAAWQRPFRCGLGTRRFETGPRTRPGSSYSTRNPGAASRLALHGRPLRGLCHRRHDNRPGVGHLYLPRLVRRANGTAPLFLFFSSSELPLGRMTADGTIPADWVVHALARLCDR
jgi:hypothetical protein